jgi:pyrimidine-nucleoside phosphorylase
MTGLIEAKRKGKAHSAEDIAFILDGLASGAIKDYQLTAWLMAVYLQGMTIDEIACLTEGMSRSGKVLDLSAIGSVVCDKHSTGGVGDKTTLVLVPLLASAGLPMAKLSGRGLAHTGGTLDKLEAIPGFNVALSEEQFIAQVRAIGAAIGSTTADFAPADGKLYQLRNETATIDSVALGSASVMSKKLAAGANLIILDVKWGKGAFMDSIERAREIAETMVAIGKRLGKQVVAVISDMNQPLGYTVGHSLEVAESIETLKGAGAPDLRALCLYLGAIALVRAGMFTDQKAATAHLEKLLDDGTALEKFRQIIKHQGGDAGVIENSELLPQSRFQADIFAEETSADSADVTKIANEKDTATAANHTALSLKFVQSIDAMKIALTAKRLAGYGSDRLNLATGIRLHVKVGSAIAPGQLMATVFADSKEDLSEACASVAEGIVFSSQPVDGSPLIVECLE